MKKLLISIAIIIIMAIAFLPIPIPLPGYTGAYNSWSGLIWCSDRNSCLHEIGHKLDDSGGWISHDDDFEITVHRFMITEIAGGNPNDLAMMLATYPIQFGREELYADIFLYSDDIKVNVPPEFRQFYNWELSEKLIEKHKKHIY